MFPSLERFKQYNKHNKSIISNYVAIFNKSTKIEMVINGETQYLKKLKMKITNGEYLSANTKKVSFKLKTNKNIISEEVVVDNEMADYYNAPYYNALLNKIYYSSLAHCTMQQDYNCAHIKIIKNKLIIFNNIIVRKQLFSEFFEYIIAFEYNNITIKNRRMVDKSEKEFLSKFLDPKYKISIKDIIKNWSNGNSYNDLNKLIEKYL
jgi:hypothetical protein